LGAAAAFGAGIGVGACEFGAGSSEFEGDDPHENAGPGIFLCRKHAGQMAEIFAAPDDDEDRRVERDGSYGKGAG